MIETSRVAFNSEMKIRIWLIKMNIISHNWVLKMSRKVASTRPARDWFLEIVMEEYTMEPW